jgi:hypothetical protein
MGWSNDVQVTQIALQSKFANAREKDQKINCLHFQINQAQQSVKTDLELAKAMAPSNMNNDELWKDVLEGRKKVKELGAQLVQMEMQNISEKLQIVNNFLRNAAPKRPAMTAPPMTPTGSSSKADCSETRSSTHASGTSNLTKFSVEPPREVQVPTPIKKPKASAESLEGFGFWAAIASAAKASAESLEGFGICAAGQLCGMPYLALNRGCFGPSGKPMHRCTKCRGIIHSGLCATGNLICKLCDQ